MHQQVQRSDTYRDASEDSLISPIAVMIDFDCGKTKLARRPQTLPLCRCQPEESAQQPADAEHYIYDAPKEGAGLFRLGNGHARVGL